MPPSRAAIAVGLLLLPACGTREAAQRTFDTARAERRDLRVTAVADGVVEPILTVEVKSKASGEIIELPVDTGDTVAAGEVLVRIDPLDARNAFDQAEADLRAAEARREMARSSLERATRLRSESLLTEADFEATVLEASQSDAAAVKARIVLDLARRRLDETTVRAAVAGTILTRNVEVGTVIASAVSQVSGGTVLFTMADLSTIQVRSLVDEAEIGRVRPRMGAHITVEAYPGRGFEGTVEKVEPQAVLQQNVTLFPVLVRLPNPDGALRPGMNAEVEVLVEERRAVLAVPLETVRAPREVGIAARFLGLDLPAADGRAQAAEVPAARERDPSGRPAVVFVLGASGPEPRPIRVGLSDWDYAEIVSGLEEGEEVIVVPSANLLRQQQEMQERLRRTRTMPGMEGNRSKANPPEAVRGGGRR